MNAYAPVKTSLKITHHRRVDRQTAIRISNPWSPHVRRYTVLIVFDDSSPQFSHNVTLTVSAKLIHALQYPGHKWIWQLQGVGERDENTLTKERGEQVVEAERFVGLPLTSLSHEKLHAWRSRERHAPRGNNCCRLDIGTCVPCAARRSRVQVPRP